MKEGDYLYSAETGDYSVIRLLRADIKNNIAHTCSYRVPAAFDPTSTDSATLEILIQHMPIAASSL